MPKNASHSTVKTQIPTNLRLLRLLEEVAAFGAPVTAAFLTAKLDLPKPTVHRLLATAEEQDFLQRDTDGRSYGPGRRLRRMAGNTLSSQRFQAERLTIMKALAEEVGETCNLSAPGRHGMIYLDRVETHRPLRFQLPVGSVVPLHCTASGKLYLSTLRNDKLERLVASLVLDRKTRHTFTDRAALLEELAETRLRGYSTDNQEFMDGMAAIAVAVEDSEGRLLSTLSIHAPVQRRGIASLEKELPRLREGAARLGEQALQ